MSIISFGANGLNSPIIRHSGKIKQKIEPNFLMPTETYLKDQAKHRFKVKSVEHNISNRQII